MDFKMVWDFVLALTAALAILASCLGSIIFLLTKFGITAKYITKKRIQKRLETCPQIAVCGVYNAKRDHKIEELHQELIKANERNAELHGSHIVLFCMFAKYRGSLDRYEKLWLTNNVGSYIGKDNGIEDIYNETLLLPEKPPRTAAKKKIKEAS